MSQEPGQVGKGQKEKGKDDDAKRDERPVNNQIWKQVQKKIWSKGQPVCYQGKFKLVFELYCGEPPVIP